jgi:hypothetical protein
MQRKVCLRAGKTMKWLEAAALVPPSIRGGRANTGITQQCFHTGSQMHFQHPDRVRDQIPLLNSMLPRQFAIVPFRGHYTTNSVKHYIFPICLWYLIITCRKFDDLREIRKRKIIFDPSRLRTGVILKLKCFSTIAYSLPR